MSYEQDLADAQREGTAWPCTCHALNPPSYDACHDCQRPSWTCATDGTVTVQGAPCYECGGEQAAEALGDRAEGCELTFEEWISLQIGPRRPGGHYWNGSSGAAYDVLSVEPGPRPSWPSWQMTVRWEQDGTTTVHSTGWDPRRDRVLTQPDLFVR